MEHAPLLWTCDHGLWMVAAVMRPTGQIMHCPLAPSLGDRTKKQRGRVEMVFLVLDSRTARKGAEQRWRVEEGHLIGC